MNHLIREMTEKDFKDVQDIAKESWHATYTGIIPLKIQDNFLKKAYSDEMMKIRLNNSYMFVAEVKKKIVGFSNFTPIDDEGKSELSAIYIYPSYQNMGIGTELLKEGINKIENINTIYLDVEKENKVGLNFYEKKGFIKKEEFDDNFDGHILKTIRMILEL